MDSLSPSILTEVIWHIIVIVEADGTMDVKNKEIRRILEIFGCKPATFASKMKD
jgi:uncharacterized tellurite resistance protein B-like protein